MLDTESYNLRAYDINTKKVFDWRDVAGKPGAPWAVGSTIDNGSERWLVVAVRPTSTARVKYVDVRRMPRFSLRDSVIKDGEKSTRTVEEIRDGAGTEPTYSIQLGSDFATRIWAKESELEPAAKCQRNVKALGLDGVSLRTAEPDPS
jgi:hypothetical protein